MSDTLSGAIKCFERLTGLKLSYYLYSSVFMRELRHMEHRNATCVRAKSFCTVTCSVFDGHYIYNNIANFPDGCVKLCHCGICEVTMPFVWEDHLLALFNGGVFRVDEAVLQQFPVIRNSAAVPEMDISEVEFVDAEKLRLYFEAMYQLRARFILWYQQTIPDENRLNSMSPEEKLMYIIRKEAHCGLTLTELAKKVNLSYSRCAHLVKEVSGHNFVELIRRYRLEHACALLKHTGINMDAVRRRSGFGDLANFHRVFKAEMGMTPLEYRKS